MPSHAKRRSSSQRGGRVIYLHSRHERDHRDDDDDELPNPRLSKGKGRKGGRRGMAGQTTVNCAPPDAKAKEGRGVNKWLGIAITGAVSALGAILAYRAWNRMSGGSAQAEIARAQANPIALPAASSMNPVTANAMNMLMATSASPATNQQIAMNAMQIQQAQLLEQSKLQLMALEAQSKLSAAASPKKRKKKSPAQMAPSLDALLQSNNDDDDDEEDED